MSVFSMIKRGRRAAKEHRAEQAKKEKEESQKAPYKHVPRHAATDAMSGGPAGWRENDRHRIVEQNRRRSAMTASGVGMSGMMTPVHQHHQSLHTGIPRVHSALSHVSYPAAYASPIVSLPRNYSYGSMLPGWTPHGSGSGMSYSPVDPASLSLKGKEVERILDSSRTSRSSSKVSIGRIQLPPGGAFGGAGTRDTSPSPVESSSNSASSRDDLEMKPVVRHSLPASIPLATATTITTTPSASSPPRGQQSSHSRAASDTESIHRLHPGRSRRVSDPHATPSRTPLAPRTSTLPDGIPPVPALPVGAALTTPEVFSSAASSASSLTMVPVASSASLAAKTGPSVVAAPKLEADYHHPAPMRAEIVIPEDRDDISESGDLGIPAEFIATPILLPTPAPAAPVAVREHARRTSSKSAGVTRFTELTTIESNTLSEHPTAETTDSERGRGRRGALPTSFEEGVLPQPREIVLPVSGAQVVVTAKTGKLSKGAPPAASKLVKKNRWSLRGKGTAVAV
ncbi:hypothetical protein C8A05DRAFT_18708 [Staphylotrichum tortipilum]|uniref:Uncharacterized protein n=1 Tax=Staphylotrichum tortipilum TaxID=2831512 RepID=A0AAN6MER4_9PEZI|nr:hypothetical protein C8A05DRAFT_18708 [Staphylotrichum longicolle]